MTADEAGTEQQYRRLVGRRIRLCRVNLDLTQEELARKSGQTRNFISEVERARMTVDAWRLSSVAAALGVPAAWLLSLDGHPMDLPQTQEPGATS